MLKNKKPDIKSAKIDLDFRKEIDSVHISKWSYQPGNHPGSGYTMFDSPHGEAEPMNGPDINVAPGYKPKNDELHWMANAAYTNQSKQR